MAGRRMVYLAALIGCLVFLYAYQAWFAWFLLVGVLCLPVLSFLISLPAMLTVRVRLRLPERTPMGQSVEGRLAYACRLPAPPVRCKLTVRHRVLGWQQTLPMGEALPTEHCGALEIAPKKLYAYDYLGLFRLPVRKKGGETVLILPKAVPLAQIPSLEKRLNRAWKPKPGGGFSERHDLRLYRPGDNLHQLHWKLSAKTGKLIYRESMEPVQTKRVLSLILPGTAEALDRDLGELLWLSEYLLERQLSHEIRALTGAGLLYLIVGSAEQLQDALAQLLSAPAAPMDAQLPPPQDAAWHYRIGGQADA